MACVIETTKCSRVFTEIKCYTWPMATYSYLFRTKFVILPLYTHLNFTKILEHACFNLNKIWHITTENLAAHFPLKLIKSINTYASCLKIFTATNGLGSTAKFARTSMGIPRWFTATINARRLVFKKNQTEQFDWSIFQHY